MPGSPIPAVLFASAEVAPFSKTGGLGDVAGSLPQALAACGCRVAVMTPKYAFLDDALCARMEHLGDFSVVFEERVLTCGVLWLHNRGIDYYFLENDDYFARSACYGFADDGACFALFSKAVCYSVAFLAAHPRGLRCNIIQCNDWHTALVPAYLKLLCEEGRDGLHAVRTVLTVHNACFRGPCYSADVPYLHEFRGIMEERETYFGCGLRMADRIVAVSPHYAEELQAAYSGDGFEDVFRRRAAFVSGILNGIDQEAWNPATDKALEANFCAGDLRGKAACKRAVQAELDLPCECGAFLAVMVCRISAQKGTDLLCACIDEVLFAGGMQLVVLGTGDAHFAELLTAFESAYPHSVRFLDRFDERMAHRLYAAGDLFLMPSDFEPCGLAQMIAMRYATLPLVRDVGGLHDTVQPYSEDEQTGSNATGFVVREHTAAALRDAILCAERVWRDEPSRWAVMQERAANRDWSWTRSAKTYRRLFEELLGGADASRTALPQWYARGVAYQIFPDRYRRDAHWRQRTLAGLAGHERGPRRVLVDDWAAVPRYERDADERVTQWDFYGGSLRGIIEDLDRIAREGYTMLYLNPLFCAASNHRYDVADYWHVDPILGTDEEFSELCREAGARGISVILDGVFAHTGRDSRYFDCFGHFAAHVSRSRESWYTFNEDGGYRCWHDIDDLPSLNYDEPSVREFFCGENGVLRHWIRAGARGWRLDAADELPGDVIAQMRAAVLAERADAVLIGEVWADVKPREHYFNGFELDGVTNYPFCCSVVEFFRGEMTASHLAGVMNMMHDNYPPFAFEGCLNMLGSHDRPRLLSLLGDSPYAVDDERSVVQHAALNVAQDDGVRSGTRHDAPDSVYADTAPYRLTPCRRALAITRLRAAVLIQFLTPGVPCVYAGDEAGVEGLDDPDNRATYPWGHEDAACMQVYRDAFALRKTLAAHIAGERGVAENASEQNSAAETFRAFSCNDDVFGFYREVGSGSSARRLVVAVNRSTSTTYDVEVPFVQCLGRNAIFDAFGTQATLNAAKGDAHIPQTSQTSQTSQGAVNCTLPPLSCAVVCG